MLNRVACLPEDFYIKKSATTVRLCDHRFYIFVNNAFVTLLLSLRPFLENIWLSPLVSFSSYKKETLNRFY